LLLGYMIILILQRLP